MPSTELHISEMAETICTASLARERGIPSFCKCPKCKAVEDRKDSLLYYQKDFGDGEARRCDSLPERER
jgi:hypothetical protein